MQESVINGTALNEDIEIDFFADLNEEEKSNVKHYDDISDALIDSLANKGRVDIHYISSLTNIDEDEVINKLKRNIYQDPTKWQEDKYLGWETKDQYLTGNIYNKLQIAKEANKKYKGTFARNISALSSLIKSMTKVDSDELFVTIGSPWLDTKYIFQFIKEVILENKFPKLDFDIKHDELSGSWMITRIHNYYEYINGRYVYFRPRASSNVVSKYGTKELDAFDIIQDTLNQTNIAIYDTITKQDYNDEGKLVEKKTRIKNVNKTLDALEKQELILAEFNKWVFADEERKEDIIKTYSNRFCVNPIREYDGSFLSFPDLDPSVSLRDYQKDAVARIILTPNTLLAHDVGSGKTYEIVAAAHELKRMGLSKKNLIVVPNGIIHQWVDVYKKMYPHVSIYVVYPKMFNPENRKKILRNIRDNDYDAIIMTYSSFDMIEMAPSNLARIMEEDMRAYEVSLKDSNSNTTYVKRKLNILNKKYKDYSDKGVFEDDPNEIYFNDLGIDRFFLDECHNYKNVPIDTNIFASGINVEGSDKCQMMKYKVSFIQHHHNGGGIVFASGTPITNSISDLYNLQRYLQEGELEIYKLKSFNAWISNFALKKEGFEIDLDTNNYRMVARYANFKNLPELSAILTNISTFHYMNNSEGYPSYDGPTNIMVKPRKDFLEYLKDISLRAELIRKHKPRDILHGTEVVKDNMLLVTTDGRKAALDLRLVNEDAPYSFDSKVYECANNVAKIYKETEADKLTQIIFCDVSTPKAGFNIYDELKRLLFARGVSCKDIAFIHDYESAKKKEKLFDEVNKGEVRILLGSTFKLGTGVNVQNKLVAIHHIDVPWRPSDMVQREGRILRPGNTNKKINIYRYICEQSFDAYSWQLLEIKQNIISSLFNNSLSLRECSDVDNTALSYAEVKALAVGNPLIKEREMIKNELNKIKSLKEQSQANKAKLLQTINNLKRDINNLELDVERLYKDSHEVAGYPIEDTVYSSKTMRSHLYNKIKKLITERYEAVIERDYRHATLISEPDQFVREEDDIYIRISFIYGTNYEYRINIGHSEKGFMKRIDNFLDHKLPEMYKETKAALAGKMLELKQYEKEYDADNNYKERISELNEKLNIINRSLNIK